MAARNSTTTPLQADGAPPRPLAGDPKPRKGKAERYRPLPTGTHGLDPELVKRDQRSRLQKAMIELIAEKGYPGVRIVDLAKLAHVSQPTFYSLYADKEDLFLSAYDDVLGQAARTVMKAYNVDLSHEQRLVVAMRAWAELAAAEPETTSLLVLGAFGAGSRALERRRRALDRLEGRIYTSRDGTAADTADLTVKAILGGIREVTAARLREDRASELPGLADELTSWATCYPRRLPDGLQAPKAKPREPGDTASLSSERARRAEGRLRPYGVKRGVRGRRPKHPTSGWSALTPTEVKVAALVARGDSTADIALALFLSRRTVQTYISHILTKLDAKSRVEIVREALRQGASP